MPNILAIETSVTAASIALSIGDAPCTSKNFESHRQQNQLLFPPLQQLLELLPDGEKLDLIIIGTGPGSYSGSRISIAAAQGIAAAHACDVVGQSSFLATNTFLDKREAIAVGDARRGSFFIAEVPKTSLPQEPKLMSREDFDAKLTQESRSIFTLDSNIQFADGSSIPLEQPTAEKHILAWHMLSPEDQAVLRNTPPAPTYLRAPFITKAKPGHPLLRGKVNERK
ncbi:tRNA (adenosine(37)-N6)-threonylcarbamoyltransferase complex dimerization subunit type 1 TsaB [Rubritalea spongiae]|uniref:tRNA (Adenosine(37)-N6)-threonylcarbamoyltransferase complex dimerization subunit type 1 TsaB n=1 Tax=Rubritalea spongiae TaxID=430797 RepID=A0ABW5E3Y2_9BACT